MGKPASWKWKLGIASIILVFFAIGYIFTDTGHQWLKAKIIEYNDELPESERFTSPWADRYLTLAWWRGNVCGDEKEAITMYKDFCGISQDKDKNTVFQTGKLSGLCSEDGKKGWGPLHPSAPDAYWAYIQLFEVTNSSQYTNLECYKYYQLFYDWTITNSPDHKPHPKFNKYWTKMRDRIAKNSTPPPVPIDFNVPLAPPWKDEDQ